MMVMEVPAVFGTGLVTKFSRSESRGVYGCLCLFVCDVQSENVHLLNGNVYVMQLLSN